MSSADYWVFDTDMQIHRIGIDPGVRAEAERWRSDHKPVAISSFSKVEFKGNYIQALILLRKKIADSDGLERAVARILKTRDRQCKLMIAQLIREVCALPIPPGQWSRTQGLLLTHLDTQIAVAWSGFVKSVDGVLDDLKCNRAREAPSSKGNHWDATIPSCRVENTTCAIEEVMKARLSELQSLHRLILALPPAQLTDELIRIRDVVATTISTGTFPWQGNTCRRTGDLLIGLQSLSANGLISSNYREQQTLSNGLGYSFKQFPLVQIRS